MRNYLLQRVSAFRKLARAIERLAPTAGDVLAFPTATTVAGRSIPGKNLINNGDFKVNQRGSTAIGTGVTAYGPDMWIANSGSTAAYTLTTEDDVPVGQGLHKSLKVDITTGDASISSGENYGVETRLEGTNVDHLMLGSANAVSVTLQFWARSRVTGIHGCALQNSASDRSYPFEYTIAVADTWEFFSKTIALDQTGTWLTTTGVGLRVRWSLGAGSLYHGTADTWEGADDRTTANQVNVVSSTGTFGLAGIQLEVGSVATAFEHEDIGTTLAKCQRYFWRETVESTNRRGIGSGNMDSTTQAFILVEFPVPMRAKSPTFSVNDVTKFAILQGGSTLVTSGIAVNWAGSELRSILYATVSGATAGNGATLQTDATDGTYYQFSSEL